MKNLLAFSLVVLMGLSCAPKERPDQILVDETLADLKENILPFWVKYSPDSLDGFYGTLRFDGTPMPQAPRGGVLNARILWTFSAAYRLFEDPTYKTLADRAQRYFIDHFIDPEYGGTFWSINADGTPSENGTQKQTYGIAFGIYGLSEHYRATDNEESLQAAIKLYRDMEEHVFDPVNGGYVESFTRDWKLPERFGYDGAGAATKTMNTHLHVMEAYTSLYRVWKDPGLEKQFRALITDIFMKKIIDTERWHERLFLTMDWTNLEHVDSYGHDMELSWLIYEAAEVLGDQQVLDQIRSAAINLVDVQMKEGWLENGALLYERIDGEIRGTLDWWPQAETVVAFYYAWQHTGDQKYLDGAYKTWNWIKNNLIDREHGEWYRGTSLEGVPQTNRAKADMWRCPYHNSRMGMELYSRFMNPEHK